MQLRAMPRERYLVTLALLTAFSVTAFALESWMPKPLPFFGLAWRTFRWYCCSIPAISAKRFWWDS